MLLSTTERDQIEKRPNSDNFRTHQKILLTQDNQLPSNGSIRVLLIDEHRVVRAGLRILIDSRPGVVVVGEADNGTDGVAIAARERPDIVLLELMIAGECGVDYIPKLLAVSKQSRVLILTGVDDMDKHRRAVAMGAMGLVHKNHTPEVLIKAIQKVHAGEAWIGLQTISLILSKLSAPDNEQRVKHNSKEIANLTRREREIIIHVGQGLKNKQIADRLSITSITVRHHLTSIFSKLQLADRFELIIYAYRYGLASMPHETAQ